MDKRCLVGGGLAALVALLIACVTVNIYFPAAEVQRAADQIVEEVRPEPPPPPPKSSSAFPKALGKSLIIRLASFWVGVAEAQVDINISTPAIRNLKASMKQRFPGLQPYYQKGVIGETNRGYLDIRDTADLGLKEKAQVKRLVGAENSDRKALYEEIIRANNLDSKVLPQVERLFANSWRKDASARGAWIQKDDGSWTR